MKITQVTVSRSNKNLVSLKVTRHPETYRRLMKDLDIQDRLRWWSALAVNIIIFSTLTAMKIDLSWIHGIVACLSAMYFYRLGTKSMFSSLEKEAEEKGCILVLADGDYLFQEHPDVNMIVEKKIIA